MRLVAADEELTAWVRASPEEAQKLVRGEISPSLVQRAWGCIGADRRGSQIRRAAQVLRGRARRVIGEGVMHEAARR